MKIIKVSLLALLVSTSAYSQKIVVTSVEIDKGFPVIESNTSFYFKLAVLTDISKFTLILDPAKTIFTKIMDNTGYDLLSAQRKSEEDNKKQGYQVRELKIKYNSPVNSYDTPGIIVGARLQVTPKAGAKSVKIEGTIGMINLAEGEKTYTINNIPTEYEYGSTGFNTEFGSILISNNGSSSVDGVSYNILRVEGMQPIVSVKVIDGDDSKEAKEKTGMGVGQDEMIFKEIPKTINLEITVSKSEVVEIPFSLDLTIGF